MPTEQTQQLADLHRQLTRLHNRYNLGRPATMMTIQGKACATMVRIGQRAIADALAANHHGVPHQFVTAIESHAIEVARCAANQIEGMTDATA